MLLPCGAVLSAKVVKEDGAVSGLLNIAKCLYDAIHRLEKKARNAAEEDKGETLAASILEVRERGWDRSLSTGVGFP